MPQHSEHALARVKHGGWLGGKEAPEHYVWRAMRARCNNPNTAAFKYYGARGIKVCKRWEKYENFIVDMGSRPTASHSLDRIRVGGDYKPSNCRWATQSEQQKNKTTTKIYSNGSFTGTLGECAEHLGVTKNCAFERWKSWGTFEKGTVWRLQKRA